VPHLFVIRVSHLRRRDGGREPAKVNGASGNCAIEQASVEKSNLELFRYEPANAALPT
jgi:hypothetical protein